MPSIRLSFDMLLEFEASLLRGSVGLGGSDKVELREVDMASEAVIVGASTVLVRDEETMIPASGTEEDVGIAVDSSAVEADDGEGVPVMVNVVNGVGEGPKLVCSGLESVSVVAAAVVVSEIDLIHGGQSSHPVGSNEPR
jgi:hypothetical protein